MTQLEMLDKVRAIVADELAVDPAEVVPVSTLAELGADSLDTIAVLSRIATELDADIPNDRLSAIETVGELALEAAHAQI